MKPGKMSKGAVVAVLLLFALLAVLSMRQVGSLDTGFHLEAGEYILEGNGWPRNDPFTYTASDHPYIDTTWGYQVVLALVQKILGPAGIVLFHTVLVLAIFWVLFRTARLASTEPAALVMVLLLGILACEMRFEARPELVSYLFFAVVLHLLHRHAEGRSSPLWALVPLHLLWINLHGGLVVLGWAACGCFLVGLTLRDRKIDRPLALWAAAAVVVTLINPYGFTGALFPLTLATRLQGGNVFAQSIGEFTSPFDLGLSRQNPFYPRAPIFSFRILAILSCMALWPAVRARRFWCPLIWLVVMALSYRMIRNMPILVIATLPLCAWGFSLSGVLGKLGVGEKRASRFVRTVLVAVCIMAALLALRVYNDAYYVASRRVDRFGFGWNTLAQPAAAADHAVAQGLNGPVLNHLDFGGWLMWALPGKVFMDGRLEVIGEDLFKRYRTILASENAMESCVARYGIEWIVFPYRFNPRLLGRLSGDRRWRAAYVDHNAVIFVRNDPTAGMPAPPNLPPYLPAPRSIEDLPGVGEVPRSKGVAQWLGGLIHRENFPGEDYNLGLFHLYRGELGQALARFNRAAASSGGAYYEIYNNLGAVLYRMKRYDEARACYEVVLQDEPGNDTARRRLAEMAR